MKAANYEYFFLILDQRKDKMCLPIQRVLDDQANLMTWTEIFGRSSQNFSEMEAILKDGTYHRNYLYLYTENIYRRHPVYESHTSIGCSLS